MIRTPPLIAGPWGQPLFWRLLVCLLYLWPAFSAAQPDSEPVERQRWEARLAANEGWLWLALVSESRSQSRLFFREAGGRFDLGRSIDQPIAALTTLDRDLLVLFDDGTIYRYSPDPTPAARELSLPRNQLPLDLVSERGRVYAIIASVVARELPAVSAESGTPATQPFDPGSALLSLAVYDGRAWNAVTPLPALVQPATDARLRPRLCLVHGQLSLFSLGGRPARIDHYYHDAENNRWMARDPIPVPPLTGFWVVNLSRVPTVVTVSDDPVGGEKIGALRLLGDAAREDVAAWRPADDLKLSDLPQEVTIARYNDGVGFNQHIGLLAIDINGQAYLRFARIAGPPAEPTSPVADILAKPGAVVRTQRLLQMFTFVLLLIVLTGLFVFRRASMVRLIALPPGCALAFNLQRMLGWLIDFAPFALVSASLLDVSLSEGLRTLARWGISPDHEQGLPEQKVLLWWAFSVVCYTTYTLVMELILRRTPGKYFARAYTLSESGTPPVAWQILARNLMRLIEFMPQFWIFVVLVLLSRNRQRMGDIFARTLVVRRTPIQRGVTDGKPARPPDEGQSEPPRDDAAARPDSDESDSARAEASDAEKDESSGRNAEQRRSSAPRDES